MGLFSSKPVPGKITITDVGSDRPPPKCPHCNNRLTNINRRTKGVMTTTFIFSCGFCDTFLGFGTTNYF